MKKDRRIKKLYFSLKRVCKIFAKKSLFFKNFVKRLNELEKTIYLMLYTSEWLSQKQFRYNTVKGINYPTIQTIRDLHDFLVIKYEKDVDRIHKGEYSLASLDFEGIKYWMYNSQDKKEDIILRGAHIFNKFLVGHPFIDGNKRTGWGTLWLFLAGNGYIFFFPMYFIESEQVEKIERWADGKRTSDNINEISKWIRQYIKER